MGMVLCIFMLYVGEFVCVVNGKMLKEFFLNGFGCVIVLKGVVMWVSEGGLVYYLFFGGLVFVCGGSGDLFVGMIGGILVGNV